MCAKRVTLGGVAELMQAAPAIEHDLGDDSVRHSSGDPARDLAHNPALDSAPDPRLQQDALQPWINAYLDQLAQQKRQSAHTVSNYRHDLHTLCVGAARLAVALEQLSAFDVRRLIVQLHAQGIGGRSLARVLSAWRGFYRYLAQQGVLQHNPVLGVRAPKSPRALPRVLSPDEANRLLSGASSVCALPANVSERSVARLLHCRDWAMFELFYSSGLRLAELAALDISCLERVSAGEVEVLGKRSKARLIPVGTQARQAIAAWAQQRGRLAKPEESALFIGQHGRRLGMRMIQFRLEDFALQQGLDSKVHPHMLRHSFASHVLQSSGDLRAVQDMLGHSSITSTQVYTHLDFQHLSKIYDQTHPRAKRK
ncbi:MAG: tyrosine recombinase XerC [Pseudomonadota bacterium]